MNQPLLYAQNNNVIRVLTQGVLNKHLPRMKWKKNGPITVLDMGSGSGDVTMEILYPKLPKNLNQLVGVDISKPMVDYSTSNNTNPKIRYELMNVAGAEVPNKFEQAFDYVFSFFCFHWISDQKRLYSNAWKMMKPNGEIFVIHLLNSCFTDAYESLLKKNKWRKYADGLSEDYVLSYLHEEHPEVEFARTLEDVGFEVKLCTQLKVNYEYSNVQSLMKTLQAVSPLYLRISENKRTEYLKDSLEALKTINVVKNDSDKVTTTWRLAVLHAQKISSTSQHDFEPNTCVAHNVM